MNCRSIIILSRSILVLIFFVLSGCATTKTSESVAGNTGQADNMPKNVRITEFILGPGDKVEISVYRHDDLKTTVQIDSSGKIIFPLVGDIQAGGISVFQLRDKIRDGLSKYIINPQVLIGNITVQSQKVMVLGEVKSPGVFTIDSSSLTAVEAISKAGGFTTDAKQKNILLIRGGLNDPDLITLNIEKVFKEHDMTQDIYLQKGDIIYVPATTIANVSRFFNYLSSIISPIVQTETGIFLGQQIESAGESGIAVSQ
ncbi:MAG: polysaccharide biosynthesis/export family protein [Nitrospirota bacterium]